MENTIIIGTRGSKLALWQAYYVQNLLENSGYKSVIEIIETKGDKIMDRSLSKIGSKGVFTEELEEQLRKGSIHIAVHSAKDLQSDLGPEFEILAFCEREKQNDVLLSHKEVDINAPLLVGTSSTRRVALLKRFFPGIQPVDIRGNLQTRMQKMQDGLCNAILLAYAGVERMQYGHLIRHTFPMEQFVPPVGQGSVAIECHVALDKHLKMQIRKSCNHLDTEKTLLCERSYLKVLSGGCSIPVFGNAQISGNELVFTAGILSLDGNKYLKIIKKGIDPIKLGETTAIELLEAGAGEILEEIKSNL